MTCAWCGAVLMPEEHPGPLCGYCLTVPVGPPKVYNHERPTLGVPAEED